MQHGGVYGAVSIIMSDRSLLKFTVTEPCLSIHGVFYHAGMSGVLCSVKVRICYTCASTVMLLMYMYIWWGMIAHVVVCIQHGPRILLWAEN